MLHIAAMKLKMSQRFRAALWIAGRASAAGTGVNVGANVSVLGSNGATPRSPLPPLPTPVDVRRISGRTTAASFGAAHDAAVRRLVLPSSAGGPAYSVVCEQVMLCS